MGEVDMPVYYNRDRRRSSFTRPMRDPEEILEGLRSLKAAKGELSRTMSLTGDKRRGSREYKRFFASLSHHFARSSDRLFVCLCTSPFARHTPTLRDSISNATTTTITTTILPLSLFFIIVTMAFLYGKVSSALSHHYHLSDRHRVSLMMFVTL